MYLNYYRLSHGPFHITPDPRYLFLSPSHKEALASIIYGIEQKKGFISIIGEVGVGKTTILRSYLENKANGAKQKTIYIFNTNTSFQGLLKAICTEMDITVDTADVSGMVNELHKALIDEYSQGRNVVLILDEAQNVPVETLERLRMLSNLETSTDKLIQVVLIGQPELQSLLDRSDLRQLKQRIAIRSSIFPLTHKESVAYIHHRLKKVALTTDPIFAERAIKLIAHEAKGIPRIINILCDNALIAGFGYRKELITVGIVKEVIADYAGKKSFPVSRWCLRTAAIFLLFSAVASLYPYDGQFFSAEKIFHRTGIAFNSPIPDPSPSALPEEPEPQSVPPQSSIPGNTSGTVEARPGDLSRNTPDLNEQEDPPAAVAVADQEVTLDAIIKQAPQSHGEGESGTPSSPSPILPEVDADLHTIPVPRATVRTVGRGENLIKIIKDRYGFCDDRLLDRVRDCNPHIRDANVIVAGEKVLLPPSDAAGCGSFPGS